MISKKSFLFGMLIGLALLFAFLTTLPDGRLHLVFCNVGQGDAAYIRTPANQDLLIDGGPDDKVLSCLGRHMPFYDKTIDTVILSHPNKDHYQGLISVLERYEVKYFITGVAGEDSKSYEKLTEAVKKKNIPLKNLYQGDQFAAGSVRFSFLWPEKQWAISQFSSDLGDLGSGNISVLGLSTTRNLNDFSYYLHLSFGSFDALFTGDGDSRIQPEIMNSVSLPDVEVLKFPHHGSKYAVAQGFLEKIKPELSVISVGKNPWGHPTAEALKQLTDKAIRYLRTDREGDIEIISDGQKWWIE